MNFLVRNHSQFYLGVTFETFHIFPKMDHLDTILFKFKVLFILHKQMLLTPWWIPKGGKTASAH